MRSVVLAITVGLLSASAHAQSNPVPDGKWEATWQTPQGAPRTAALELQGGSGTFRNVGTWRGADACFTRPAPAKIEMKDGEPYLTIMRSQALAGCQDSSAKLTVGADGSMTAAFPDGRPVVYKKQ